MLIVLMPNRIIILNIVTRVVTLRTILKLIIIMIINIGHITIKGPTKCMTKIACLVLVINMHNHHRALDINTNMTTTTTTFASILSIVTIKYKDAPKLK
jgi:hypothetical protein